MFLNIPANEPFTTPAIAALLTGYPRPVIETAAARLLGERVRHAGGDVILTESEFELIVADLERQRRVSMIPSTGVKC